MENFYPEQLENYDRFSKDSFNENNFPHLDDPHMREINHPPYIQQPYMQMPNHAGYGPPSMFTNYLNLVQKMKQNQFPADSFGIKMNRDDQMSQDSFIDIDEFSPTQLKVSIYFLTSYSECRISYRNY